MNILFYSGNKWQAFLSYKIPMSYLDIKGKSTIKEVPLVPYLIIIFVTLSAIAIKGRTLRIALI